MDKHQFAASVQIAKRGEFQVYFYSWEIGQLAGWSREYRFEYSPNWKVELAEEDKLALLATSQKYCLISHSEQRPRTIPRLPLTHCK
jgi:hypothetical protein